MPIQHFSSHSPTTSSSPAGSPPLNPSSSSPLASAAPNLTLSGAPSTISPSFSYREVRKRSWGKWVAEIREPRKRSRIWLGSYCSPEGAARAFDVAAYCLRGPSTRMNLPDSLPLAVKSLPFALSPKSVQRVASAAGSMADCSASTSSSASRNKDFNVKASASAAPPNSDKASITPIVASATAALITTAPNATEVSITSTEENCKAERIGSRFANFYCYPSDNPRPASSFKGRRGNAFFKPPRLSIVAARGSLSTAETTRPISSCAANGPGSTMLGVTGEYSIQTACQSVIGGEEISSRLMRHDTIEEQDEQSNQVATFDWLKGARLETSPMPTIEQIADAMLLMPPCTASTPHGSAYAHLDATFDDNGDPDFDSLLWNY